MSNIIKNLPELCRDSDIINDNANTYLGNRGYCIYKNSIDEKSKNFIRNKLIAKPRTLNMGNNEISYPIYMESNNKLYLPRYFGIKYFGYPKVVKINTGKNIDLNFRGELRDYQISIIDTYIKYIGIQEKDSLLLGKGGGSIEVGCGRGKTVMALKIIQLIGKKTRIIVHKDFLKNQWIERINQFLPDAKIGCIQGQIIDIEDKDIVIIMLQSLSQKEYPEEIFKDFGLTIVDECHHISSEVFSKSLQTNITVYSLALSATMNRKDGLSWVFKSFLGELIYKEDKRQDDDVLVKAIKYNVENDDEYNEVEVDMKGNIKYSTMISKLCNYNSRSEFIVKVIQKELNINENQQIILLSHNKSLLTYLEKAIKHRNVCSIGYYIGGMKEKDLKESETKKIILATYQMAAEALDIKSLTTLILATPKTDIIQACGRILREKHDNPLVIDIIDTHDVFKRQFEKRKKFYLDNKYRILKTDNDKYFNNDENDIIWEKIEKNTKKNRQNNIKCYIDVNV
tara:strand:+ start:2224 stop:3759 length:1536 start_codon:yes stop_codon:yes gene_type:complete